MPLSAGHQGTGPVLCLLLSSWRLLGSAEKRDTAFLEAPRHREPEPSDMTLQCPQHRAGVAVGQEGLQAVGLAQSWLTSHTTKATLQWWLRHSEPS